MRFIQLSWITTNPSRAWVGSVSNKHNPSKKSGIDACISCRITTVIHVVNNRQMNNNCFNEPFAVLPYRSLYWDMHGLIFETSIWLLAGSTRLLQDWQPATFEVGNTVGIYPKLLGSQITSSKLYSIQKPMASNWCGPNQSYAPRSYHQRHAKNTMYWCYNIHANIVTIEKPKVEQTTIGLIVLTWTGNVQLREDYATLLGSWRNTEAHTSKLSHKTCTFFNFVANKRISSQILTPGLANCACAWFFIVQIMLHASEAPSGLSPFAAVRNPTSRFQISQLRMSNWQCQTQSCKHKRAKTVEERWATQKDQQKAMAAVVSKAQHLQPKFWSAKQNGMQDLHK